MENLQKNQCAVDAVIAGASLSVAAGAPADVTEHTALISWSMAKSITQAVIGMLVGDGLLDIDAPAAVSWW